MSFQKMILCSGVVLLALLSLAQAGHGGESYTELSNHLGYKYNYGISHAPVYGHGGYGLGHGGYGYGHGGYAGYGGYARGSSYPHGYGGFGSAHGSYGIGGGHYLGALDGGYGGHGGYGY